MTHYSISAYHIEALSFIFSVLLVRRFIFKKISLYSRVLADFYKFHWTFKINATLTIGNRFLEVQISLIWVVAICRQKSYYCGSQLKGGILQQPEYLSSIIC